MKKAYGFCDRTGFRYPIGDLVPQYENQKDTGLLVGRDMVDIDQEQQRLGDVDASDEQNLENPRPDLNLAESRGLASFDPIGGGITAFGSRTVGLDAIARAGRVTI